MTQLVNFLLYLNLPLSIELKTFLHTFDYANMDTIPNIFEYIVEEDEFNELDGRLKEEDVGADFLLNYGSVIGL